MRNLLLCILAFLVLVSATGFAFEAQSGEAAITLLNRSGQPAIRITDGDIIRIQVTLPQPVAVQQAVTFTLGEASSIVGSCTIPSGDLSCMTESVPALGWYWDSAGSAHSVRTVQAFTDVNKPLGTSQPVNVGARPVVLVHGFISSWETWKQYLGSDGYLDSLGVHGFAVGDGQVPGVMNTGVITNPPGRTNSIAQNADILGQYIAGIKEQTGAEMVDLVVHS
ncbi:MAG TPA: hypothetical protein VHO49_20710, partial [Anaerolineales bacterium]|nr:hypothetical protein [Anaerolineales bacterium]